jgi:hypothetical protein
MMSAETNRSQGCLFGLIPKCCLILHVVEPDFAQQTLVSAHVGSDVGVDHNEVLSHSCFIFELRSVPERFPALHSAKPANTLGLKTRFFVHTFLGVTSNAVGHSDLWTRSVRSVGDSVRFCEPISPEEDLWAWRLRVDVPPGIAWVFGVCRGHSRAIPATSLRRELWDLLPGCRYHRQSTRWTKEHVAAPACVWPWLLRWHVGNCWKLLQCNRCSNLHPPLVVHVHGCGHRGRLLHECLSLILPVTEFETVLSDCSHNWSSVRQ